MDPTTGAGCVYDDLAKLLNEACILIRGVEGWVDVSDVMYPHPTNQGSPDSLSIAHEKVEERDLWYADHRIVNEKKKKKKETP